jgi:membrane protein DedA with SNARE-associated domain
LPKLSASLTTFLLPLSAFIPPIIAIDILFINDLIKLMFHTIGTWLDPYVTWLAHAIVSQSALAPLFLLFLEESGIPLFIPGDAVLAYTGYQLSVTGATPLWLAFAVAMGAVLLGSSILFMISRRWGHIIVDKIGKFIFLKQSDIAKAERLFQKYGIWTIIVGRHIPGMRIPLTIFAGAAGMRYRTFILSTLASTAIWVLITLSIGRHFGHNFERLLHKNVGIGLALIGLAVLVIIVLHFVGSYEHKNKPKRDRKSSNETKDN